MILVNDEYLLEIGAKQLKTGTLIVIIFSILVFSSQLSFPPLTSGKDGYKKYIKTTSEIRAECSYSDYEIWAHEDNFLDTLAAAPLAQLINSKILLKLVVLPSGEYDKDAASRMINNLSKIPDCILDKLLISGEKIKLIKGILTDEPEYAYLKGVIPRGYEGTGMTWDDLSGLGGYPNVVVKIGYSEQTEGTINLELHETGHAVDCVFNYMSKNDSFHKIWREEVFNLFSDASIFDYVNKYADEYFAESFVMYFYNCELKEKLKEKAPSTYELISELASSFAPFPQGWKY